MSMCAVSMSTPSYYTLWSAGGLKHVTCWVSNHSIHQAINILGWVRSARHPHIYLSLSDFISAVWAKTTVYCAPWASLHTTLSEVQGVSSMLHAEWATTRFLKQWLARHPHTYLSLIDFISAVELGPLSTHIDAPDVCGRFSIYTWTVIGYSHLHSDSWWSVLTRMHIRDPCYIN